MWFFVPTMGVPVIPLERGICFFLFVFYFASRLMMVSAHRADLLSCRNKKVGKEMLPRRLPNVRGLLAYSVKLRDSTSCLTTQARRPWLAPSGFHLRLAKRLSLQAHGELPH